MKQKIFGISILVNFTFFGFFIYFVYFNHNIKKINTTELQEFSASDSKISDFTRSQKNTRFDAQFDYSAFLDENSLITPWEVVNQLNNFEVENINDSTIEEFVFFALTTKAFEAEKKFLNFDNPNKIIQRLRWAERYENSALIEDKYSLLLMRISDYWFQKLSVILEEEITINKSLKYCFDFIYIYNRLGENHYYSPIKYSDFDKAIINLSDGRFDYMRLRFSQKSALFKSMVISSVILTFTLIVLGCFQVFKIIVKLNNSNEKF
jgi:hypothetical protein